MTTGCREKTNNILKTLMKDIVSKIFNSLDKTEKDNRSVGKSVVPP